MSETRAKTRKILDRLFKDPNIKKLLDRLRNPPCDDPICKERDCIVAQMEKQEVIKNG
jgi:hypothetical protein